MIVKCNFVALNCLAAVKFDFVELNVAYGNV